MEQSVEARNFAVEAHGDQTYGPGEPYVNHLDDVATLVGDDNVARTIAYLHDVVEDTPVSQKHIQARFGTFIAECIELLTDEPGINRKSRKIASHAKLAKVQPSHYVALKVKTADRLANVQACVRKGNIGLLEMYRREQPEFRKAVYRPGLCDHMWDAIEKALATNIIR